MPKSYLNNSLLPRGLRNNNPGNLVRSAERWEGKIPFSQSTDTHFEQFIELRYGIRALMRDLISDFTKGSRTITAIISEFAPNFENNTGAYISSVAASIGYAANELIPILDQQTLVMLCKAIIKVENGNAFNGYVADSDYSDALTILGKTLPESKKKS